ncbi:MAG: TrkA family potassium uptake protein [Chloroflexota bacterium]|nr:TrkA family potassium uptake protein [Chloroflexota bacterium]MDE2959763.1 TrkA family potassium uptake protein [Chloroflexota bacterium]
MAKQVCVIGLGRFGAKLASTLFQREHEVLAIDQDEQRVQEMLGRVTYAVEANATNETALRDLGVADMDVAVVALGSQIQSSIIVTMMLKSMGLPYVIARATDTQHAEILHRVGADKVIFPEEEAAERAASLDLSPNYVEFMHITDDTGVHKLRPPENMRGKSLRDAGLVSESTRHHVSVMVIRRGNEYIINPAEEEMIDDGDILVVVGSHEDVERAFAR